MQAQSLPETQKQATADATTIKLREKLAARPNLGRLSSRKPTMRGQNQANREMSHTAAYRPNLLIASGLEHEFLTAKSGYAPASAANEVIGIGEIN